MSRGTKMIIGGGAVLLVLVLIGGGVYLYLPLGEIDPETGEQQTLNDIFPIVGSGDTDTQTTGTTTQQESSDREEVEAMVPQLRHISTEPTAGAVFVPRTRQVGTTTTESYPEIRYITREEGQIRAIPADASGETTLISDTVTRIQRALWTPDGGEVLLQRLGSEGVETHHLSLTTNDVGTTTQSMEAEQLTFVSPITSYAVHPAEPRFGTVEETQNGARFVLREPPVGSETIIGTMPTREWRVDWPSSSFLTLTTKAASGAPGYMYTLSPSSGMLDKVLGNVPGLTAKLSPDGSTALYSESSGRSVTLYNYERESGETQDVAFTTLPEKCAYHPDGEVVYCGVPTTLPGGRYPDVWYQGKVSFTDELWQYNTETNEAERLMNPAELPGGEEIDMTDLSLSSEGDYLLFTNRKDGGLWSYRFDTSTSSSGTSSEAADIVF